MSAKKSGPEDPVVGSPDPAAVVLLAREVRRLLRYHMALGLDHYPASDPVRSFLETRPVPRTGAPVRPRPRARNRRDAGPAAETVAPRLPVADALRELRRAVRSCALCDLAGKSPERNPGAGAEAPRLLVVGDWGTRGDGAGGRTFGAGEDEMLAKMMAAIDLAENEYHLTNVLKCFPGDDHPPAEAAEACRAWLVREIVILRPRLVCAMGELAMRVLTGRSQPLARSHGRFFGCRCVPDLSVQVLPTYHPRLLLRQPELKRVAWQDLQQVARYLARGDGPKDGRARAATPRRAGG